MAFVAIALRGLLLTTTAVGIVAYLLLGELEDMKEQNYRSAPARHDEAEDACIQPTWERAATHEQGQAQVRAVDDEPSELKCIRV